MKRIAFFRIAVACAFIALMYLPACGGGGGTPSDEPLSVNSLDGATGVAVGSAFKYTFSSPVTASTVTSGSFFIVPAPAAAAIVAGKADPDPAVCDPAGALDASVSAGFTSATLTPSSNLDGGTGYAICLTSDILYADGTSFAGFMASFTTAGGAASYTVGGTVAGLGTGESVVLQNNAADDLTVSADGAFTFATTLADGAAYAVTVLTAPAMKTCTVGSGTGTVAGANVTDVNVVCSVNTYTVGGTVAGLSGTVVLQNNSADDLSVSANGAFTFATPVADGGDYAVTIKTQPADQFCSVTNGVGTIAGANVTNVGVACVPLWSKSTTAGTETSYFTGVATDADGNSYAVGSINENGLFGFGNGVTVQGAHAGENALIVKYGADGKALWAKSTAAASATSGFMGVAVASDGSVYAAGWINGNAVFNFGTIAAPVNVTSPYTGHSVLLVKYNSSGVAQWAKTVGGTTDGASELAGVAVDGSGNAIAVGYVDDAGALNPFDFGNSKTLPLGISDSQRAVIVKYSDAGLAQWVNAEAGDEARVDDNTMFSGVGIDGSGNAYAVGQLYGNFIYDFGDLVEVQGAYAGGLNVVIVKYSSAGVAQVAKSVNPAPEASVFRGVAVDGDANAYAVGYIMDDSSFDFGNAKTAQGALATLENAVIVKYDSNLLAQWAKTTVATTDYFSDFYGVAVDDDANAYAVGMLGNELTFNFGTGQINGKSEAVNVVMVKYSSAGNPLNAVTADAATPADNSYSNFNGVAIGLDGVPVAAGVVGYDSAYDLGNGKTVSGFYNGGDNAGIAMYLME